LLDRPAGGYPCSRSSSQATTSTRPSAASQPARTLPGRRKHWHRRGRVCVVSSAPISGGTGRGKDNQRFSCLNRMGIARCCSVLHPKPRRCRCIENKERPWCHGSVGKVARTCSPPTGRLQVRGGGGVLTGRGSRAMVFHCSIAPLCDTLLVHKTPFQCNAMPIVDPDPAGIGTYLVSVLLLACGIAIFLHILIADVRATRSRHAAAYLGAISARRRPSASGTIPSPRVRSTRCTSHDRRH
jgi:hypothetical protein